MLIVGIDLGTTHSLVGLWRDGAPVLVPNALGDVLTPSVVGVDDAGHVLVGAAARERLLTHPTLTKAAFKRHMGSERVADLGGRAFRAEELSALVLRALVDDVEAQLGERPKRAVISVPAYFSDAQRKATRIAAEIAGLDVDRLINEPTAAAVAYGLQRAADESSFLVLDLGGGTFDVSLLETFDGVIEVHASAGDNFLGGEDFTTAIVAALADDLDLRVEALPPAARARLRRAAEQLKCRLSTSDAAQIEFDLGDGTRSWSLDQARFEALCEPLVQRLRAPIERAVRDARIDPAALDEVVLVGGASRMPLLSRLVARLFGRLPLRHLKPDEVIALGAATVAGMRADHAEFREVVLTDVCPYTLGVEISRREPDGRRIDGMFSPVIERNTVVPASRVQRYSPIEEGQRAIDLRVYQGESPWVSGNVWLGCLHVELPARPIEEIAVDVRFTYDTSGVLEVEAALVPDGKVHRVVIDRNPGVLTPAQVAERLAALQRLKIHPREEQANRAVLARADRLYAEMLGAVREQISQAIADFQAELASQDPHRIERARRRVSALLDQIDASPFGG